MNAESLRKLLSDVRDGQIDPEQALERLRDLPYEDIGYARLDHHRAIRTGHAEAVFCQGKTADQVAEIFQRLSARHPRVIGTRANEEAAEAVKRKLPGAVYHPLPRMIVHVREAGGPPAREPATIVVCAAGTADLPVAEEAALTVEVMGSRVVRLWDVGVAGIHRILEHRAVLSDAAAVIAVAGMEGALGSIVAGLAASPVIAVPTSVGYGASFGGLSALLTMINSCAPGLAVVNIDNGFGAGYMAHMIAAGKQDRSNA